MVSLRSFLPCLGRSNESSTPAQQNTDGYVLSRGYAASCRQNQQYYIWTDDGFVLHPDIPTDRENIRVAEIGVGTGIWLTNLSRLLPPSAHIDGFDISLDAAPPEEWLPSNVSIHKRDMLKPIPQELFETYDLVHIQLFHLAVHNNDPVPILRNLLKLLKPGGYISWGEYDYSTWSLVRTAKAEAPDEELTRLMDYTGTMGDTKPSWTRDYWPAGLPETFKAEGLVNVALDRRFLPKEMLVYQLSAALAACEEVSYLALDKLGGGQGDKMRRMIQHVWEHRKETAYDIGRLTAIGQKPLRDANGSAALR